MIDDVRKFSSNLGASGSYSGSNKVFGSILNIFTTPNSASFNRSGKIVDITVCVQTSSNAVDMDFLFFSSLPTLAAPGQPFNMSFSDIQSCVARVRVEDTDFVQITSSAVATIFNVNATFQSKNLYMVSVYQHATEQHTFPTGSVYVNVGYSLGQSN
jgi:hypothetical protein